METKEVSRVRQDEEGGWGEGVRPLLVKNCSTLSAVWAVGRHAARCSCHSPVVTWAHVLSLQKKFTEAQRGLSQGRLVHGADGLPEHSPSGGGLYGQGPALRKTLRLFLAPPGNGGLGHSQSAGHRAPGQARCLDGGRTCVAFSRVLTVPHVSPYFIHRQPSLLLPSRPGGELGLTELSDVAFLTGLRRACPQRVTSSISNREGLCRRKTSAPWTWHLLCAGPVTG